MDDTANPPLPGVLAEIAEIAGVDAAWAVARAKGGQQVFIPKECQPGHWLSRLVGTERANQICAYYRGNHVRRVLVPIGSALQRQKRFAEAMGEGLSVDGTAGLLGVHRRTIQRHRKKARHAGQPSLFDD